MPQPSTKTMELRQQSTQEEQKNSLFPMFADYLAQTRYQSTLRHQTQAKKIEPFIGLYKDQHVFVTNSGEYFLNQWNKPAIQ